MQRTQSLQSPALDRSDFSGPLALISLLGAAGIFSYIYHRNVGPIFPWTQLHRMSTGLEAYNRRDRQIELQVRTLLNACVSNPEAIHFNVKNGRLLLEGALPASEAREFRRQLHFIENVDWCDDRITERQPQASQKSEVIQQRSQVSDLAQSGRQEFPVTQL